MPDPRFQRQSGEVHARARKTTSRPQSEYAAERAQQAWESEHPERFESAISGDPNYTPAQRYQAAGISPRPSANAHIRDAEGVLRTHTQERFDLEDPDTGRPLYDKSAVPPRWEDLPEDVRKNTEFHLRKDYGITHDSSSRAFGAQVDQAASEAATAGESHLRGGDWYRRGGEGAGSTLARARVLQEEGIPTSRQELAVAVGPTSRNTAFVDAAGVLQNIDAAEVSVRMAHGQTVTPPPSNPENLANRGADRPTAASTGQRGKITSPAIPDGAEAVRKHRAGATIAESISTPSSDTKLGGPPRKVGAYVSALDDPGGPETFTVTDVHTSAGFAPHLDKTTRETMLNRASKTFRPHEFFDYDARQVSADRGGGYDVDELQSSQWRQQRGYAGHDIDVPEKPKPPKPGEDQMRLF